MSVKCLFCLMAVTLNEICSLKLPIVVKSQSLSGDIIDVNTTQNPCEDFYRYSCDKWVANNKKPAYEPLWNPWIAVSYEIKRRVIGLLDTHNPTLIKPQIFYRSCLGSVNYEHKYLAELASFVNGLGGWPLIAGKKWRATHNSWLGIMAKAARLLDIHPILKIHLDLDYQDPASCVIYVEPGDLIFPKYILTDPSHASTIKIYEKWILESIIHIYGNVTRDLDKDEVKKIVEFETQLARIAETKPWNERTTVRTLYEIFPVNWLSVLETIFGDFIDVRPDTTIVIKNFLYLKNLAFLIRTSELKVVENYLMWCIIKDLSRDTTQYLRNLNFLVDQAILGVQEDLSREHECVDKVIQYFNSFLLPSYLQLYSNVEVFRKVTAMTDSIKDEFINILRKSEWLSKRAKLLSIRKVKNIRLYLVPSLETFNEDFEYHHHKLFVTNNYFNNIVKLKNFKIMLRLTQLLHKKTVVWPSSPFEVNAFYSVLQNAVFLPLGLLELPFFHNDRDEIFNYGSLGSLIGHEISHALDPVGIRADATGKVRKWFPEADFAKYKSRINCFGDETTIGENIADESGIRISLGAYKNQHQNTKRAKTDSFFASFAQTWCEVSENTDIFTGDEHAHVSDRVRSLHNIEQFRKAFNCSPLTSCRLW